MIDAHTLFLAAIRSTGLEPPDVIVTGQWYRFPGFGKGPCNRAGWCLLFEDGKGGCFGDWASDFTETWQVKRHQPYSRTERATFSRQVKAVREQCRAERDRLQANAANVAGSIWKAATTARTSHPYLIRKGIQPHGAKYRRGALVLPVRSFTRKLTSLQFIGADGGKRLLSGGRKKGCFIPVTGGAEETARILICEGWATGCTLAEDDPSARVLAAIDACNLAPVAASVRRRWPETEIIVAGDDDRQTEGNPGATKAREAAIAADALLALPQWPIGCPKDLTDFNDLSIYLATAGGLI